MLPTGLRNRITWFATCLLAITALGCAPMITVGGGLGFWGVALVLSASLVFVSPVMVNSSEPTTIEITQWTKKESCSTYTSCKEGVAVVSKRCCPKGARCNYAYRPVTKCADDTCVEGYRVICPPEASQEEKEACTNKRKAGSRLGDLRWRIICDFSTNKMVAACAGVGAYPTNYSGPREPVWRPFRVCAKDRCVPKTDKDGCASLKKSEAEVK